MKPNLILHIGSPKTGSSSIQKSLISNFEVLRAHGFQYLNCLRWHDGAHHKLAFSLRGVKYNDECENFESCLELISDEIATLGDGIETIIISSEIMFFDITLQKDRFDKLTSLFANTRVITFLRDPVDYLNSLYKQMVKDPNDRLSVAPREFIESNLEGINYQKIVTSYFNSVDKITIKRYEKDVTSIFYNEALCINNGEFSSLQVNPSLDGAALKLKLRVNKDVQSYDMNKQYNKYVLDYVEHKKLLVFRAQIFTAHDIHEIISFYNSKNIDLIQQHGMLPKYNYPSFNFPPVSDETYSDFVNSVKEIYAVDK